MAEALQITDEMGWMSRLYVRCGADADLLGRLRAANPGTVIEAPSEFASVPVPDGGDDGAAAALQLSRRFGAEVILLGYVSSSDAFGFAHCIEGRTLRRVQYGWREQGSWEVVAGQPEAWEEGAFFHDSAQLDDVDEDDPEREDALAIFRERRVREGAFWPILNAREAARSAARHYRLSDWLDDWADGTEWTESSVIATRTTVADALRDGVSEAAKEVTPGRRPWWRFW